MTKTEARRTIREQYRQSGCVRWANQVRRESETSQKYKKGYEARIACGTLREVAQLSKALKTLGLVHGRPYAKNRQTVVPVYGKERVETIMKIARLARAPRNPRRRSP